MLYYSETARGFFDSAIHSSIPGDAVEITAEGHASLLAAQSQGKVIVPDEDGRPIAADQPPPTDEDLVDQVRSTRNARLTACDWTQLPDAALTSEQRADWAVYRQALRDVPGQATFPASVDWPTQPA